MYDTFLLILLFAFVFFSAYIDSIDDDDWMD